MAVKGVSVGVRLKIVLLLTLVLSTLVCFYATDTALAYKSACDEVSFDDPMICGYGSGSNESALQSRIRSSLNTVYLWIGIVAVVVIVIGGIQYMLSAGETKKITDAKNTILYAIIGLIVTLAAFAMTNFIINAIGETIGGEKLHEEVSEEDVPVAPRPSSEKEWAVTSVTLSRQEVTTEVGGVVALSAEVLPKDAVDSSLTWSSGNESVATVDQNGKITAKSGGTTTITAMSRNGISGKATILVNDPVDNPEVRLLVDSDSIMDEQTTMARVIGNRGVVNWTSSNKSVMTVDENGKIVGKKPGTATLTARTMDSLSNQVTRTKEITVREIKILWVGNSKTYVKDLDKKAVEMMKNRGYSVSSTRVTEGGKTLEWNYTNQGANINKYYDYAILQEQTNASINEEKFYAGAFKISKALKSKNSNVKVYIRKAWYLRDSDNNTRNKANTVAANVASRIATNAGVVSDTINDGDAIYSAKDNGFNVFGDERHQNNLGAYTAAACIASKVFNVDPTTISYVPGDFSASERNSLELLRFTAEVNCYNR